MHFIKDGLTRLENKIRTNIRTVGITVIETVPIIITSAEEQMIGVAEVLIYTECIVVVWFRFLGQCRVENISQQSGAFWCSEVRKYRLGNRIYPVGRDDIALKSCTNEVCPTRDASGRIIDCHWRAGRRDTVCRKICGEISIHEGGSRYPYI